MKIPCKAIVHYVGPQIINLLQKKIGPDQICLSLNVCSNKECRIKSSQKSFNRLLQQKEQFKFNLWSWLKHILFDRFGDGHLPVFDLDNDSFSDVSTLRGYHWRGPDCNQYNDNVYPGRKQHKNHFIDHDCNGIFGVNQKGKSYQQMFCQDSIHLGIGVVGDSAGAHFSIPSRYMNVSQMHKNNFKDLLPRIADQFDIPHQSAYTGYLNKQFTHSIYKRMRNHNLCINNDYQNLGVNGGSSSNSKLNMEALARDPSKDHPMLMFFELIGNDVCQSGLSHMSKEKFKSNVLKLLNQLDKNLPKGSHIWIFGLVDGRILYDTLNNKYHPLNVTYPQVYDFLNCLKISPCYGYLNTNQEIRNYTANLANQLNNGYREIIQENHIFQNFDIVYYDFPVDQILQRHTLNGGKPQQLIQPCDGFHPSGLYNSYLADWIWIRIIQNHSDWIGQSNPHNSQIKNIFKIPNFL